MRPRRRKHRRATSAAGGERDGLGVLAAEHAMRCERVGVIIVGPGRLRVTEVNDALCAIWGRSRDEITARGFRPVTAEGGEAFADFFAGRADRVDTDVTFLRPDGSHARTHVYGRLVRRDGRRARVAFVEDVGALSAAAPHTGEPAQVTATPGEQPDRHGRPHGPAGGPDGERDPLRAARDALWDMTDDFMVIAEGTAIRDANPAYCQMIGSPRDELVGEDSRRFLGTAAALADSQNGASSGAPYEVPVRTSGGQVRWVRWTTRFADGVSYSVGTDITDVVHAREKLESSERMFRSITQSTTNAVVVVDRDLRVVFWGDGAQRIHGACADTMRGRDITTVIAADDRDAITRAVRDAIERARDHTPVDLSAALIRERDGAHVAVDVSATGWMADESQPRCTLMMRDVTAWREAQRDATRLATVVEGATDAVIITTVDGRVLNLNANAERLLGVTAAQAAGRRLRDVPGVPAAIPRGLDTASLRERMRRSGTVTFDLRSETEIMPGSNVSAATVTVVPLPDETGQVTATAIMVRDLTEREALLERNVRAEMAAALAEALQKITDAALQHNSMGSLARAVLGRVADAVGGDTDRGFVALADPPGSAHMRVAASFGAAPAPGDRIDVCDDAAWRAASTGDTAVVEGDGGGLLDGAGASAWIGLGDPGRPVGVLALGGHPGDLLAERARVVDLVAYRVRVAVAHVASRERERDVSETLQRSLLPDRLPALPGLSLGSQYLPGSDGHVGGDWYDALTVAGGRVVLVIGDIAGSGVAAAALMGHLRSALRAYAVDTHDPPELLERLDRLIERQHPEEMATAAIATVDLSDGSVTCASAGHPPPLRARADGSTVDWLAVPGPPLGVPGAGGRKARVRVLGDSDRLLLYTDGLVERRDVAIDERLGELRSVLAGVPAALSASEVCETVARSMVGGPGEQQDDVALLAARWEPAGDTLRLRLAADVSSLPLLRAALRRWLRAAGVSETDEAAVTLAAGEAATNAVEHAYGPVDDHFEVHARASAAGDGAADVTVVVRDRGEWRAEGSGRGLGTGNMRAVMDDVDVRGSEDGTEVTLRRRVAVTTR